LLVAQRYNENASNYARELNDVFGSERDLGRS